MKKVVLITLMLLVFTLPVAANQDIFQLLKSTFPIFVNGQEMKSDLPVLSYEGNTYVPLRKVAEITGAKVEWDEAAKTIKINNEMEIIQSTIDGNFTGYDLTKKYYFKNGQVWEQTSSEKSVAGGLNLGAVIFKAGAEYKLRIDGESQITTVKRIK